MEEGVDSGGRQSRRLSLPVVILRGWVVMVVGYGGRGKRRMEICWWGWGLVRVGSLLG